MFGRDALARSSAPCARARGSGGASLLCPPPPLIRASCGLQRTARLVATPNGPLHRETQSAPFAWFCAENTTCLIMLVYTIKVLYFFLKSSLLTSVAFDKNRLFLFFSFFFFTRIHFFLELQILKSCSNVIL